ncbi:MAG: RIP metalloprotease RseP [Nitrospiraceae bacterium]|nr:RIP metalloprotease RseP [Nitrospiraceae bacterium]
MTLLWAAILLGLLIFVHELGHFLLAKLMGVKVLKFSLGFGPRVAGFTAGGTEYLISALPLGGYVKMLGEEQGEEIPQEEKKFSFNSQPVWKRGLIALAGPVFNLLLTFVIFVSFLSVKLPVNIPRLSDMKAQVGEVVKGSPADEAGIKAGDKIVEIDGRPVNTWLDIVALVSGKPGQKLLFKVQRGAQTLSYYVTPEPVQEKTAGGKVITFGRIGIQRTGGEMPFYVITAGSPLAVPFKAAEATYRLSAFVWDAIWNLVTGAFSLKSIGGPIAIVQESGKAAAMGVFSYLMFMAFISANLAVLNLLPIPILDGGHIFFLAIEGVRGKPLSETVQMNLQRIGLLILIIIMAFALHNDILRLLRGG